MRRRDRRPGPRQVCGRLLLALACSAGDGAIAADADDPPLPSFAELEAAGARIGEIRIVNRDIYDTDNPATSASPYRAANALHVRTRKEVIERALLFKHGELLKVHALDETERLLHGTRYLCEATFRPIAYHDGIVDIEVETRDAWTLDPGFSIGRAGGVNTGNVHVKDYNLFGTGITAGIAHVQGVDRSGDELVVSSARAFGTPLSVAYAHASNTDGQRDAAEVTRPFESLDGRWAAGASYLRDDRVDAIYNAGTIASQYRHQLQRAEVFGGWSPGLVNGWVQRYSAGVSYADDLYHLQPGAVAPASLPADETLVAPFVRAEVIEDRFEKQLNRNLIGRPEFFALGLSARLHLGIAPAQLGSTQDTLLYSGSISRGFEPRPDHRLIVSGSIDGQFVDGQVRRQRTGGQARYFLPQDNKRWLLYGAATVDVLTRPDVGDELQLGGDNGLRGYPLRYQAGERRALFTLEERYYTDWCLFDTLHVGAAMFADVGRAWGGHNVNTLNPGWLADLGVGLRFVSPRSAFGNVVHVDLATPLNATSDVRRIQFLIKTKTSF